MCERAKKLLDICKKHIEAKDLVATKSATYCNFFVQRIAQEFLYEGLRGLTANLINAKMIGNPDVWFKEGPEIAQKCANDGRFVIASIVEFPHGHVAIVVPGSCVYSSKWKAWAPCVASVGRKNEFTTANWAFRKQPDYFIYGGKDGIA